MYYIIFRDGIQYNYILIFIANGKSVTKREIGNKKNTYI